MTKTPLERFAEKIKPCPETFCWNWTGCVNSNGYSQIGIDGKIVGGHRFAYVAFKGPVPEGLEVHHKCRNRRCVNPNHLHAITHKENTDHERMKTHCKHGHPFIEGSFHVYKTKSGLGRWCKICALRRSANQRLKKRGLAPPL